MPETLESVMESFEQTTELPRMAELAVVSPISKPSPIPRARQDFDADDITEDLSTILEMAKNRRSRSPFYILLLSPYYPEPLSVKVGRYFHEVRQRMIESREYDRVHYYHTLYQKFRRAAKRTYLQFQANLRA